MTESNIDRRDFLKTTGTAAVAASALSGLAAAPSVVRAANTNSVLRIGFIGPGGRGHGAHIGTLKELQKAGENIDLVAVCDVYSVNRDRAAHTISSQTNKDVAKYVDYRDMLAKEKLDAVCIATPDHWHAKQAIDAMEAGLNVYCEKPMTHTIEEAVNVVRTWQKTGKVMQVGVQSTSLPLWSLVREKLQSGLIGKMLMYQTEFFRNSAVGQWRTYQLKKEMNPETINWPLWLGVKEGLAPDVPFDREIFAQWRRFWPYGSGMYTDLFVHRTTSMLKATGLRYPARVVGAGGIFFEYDGRDVPDVATVVADFHEGVQGLVTATMCCDGTPIRQLIRGHNGSFVFGNGEEFTGFDFVPERPQVTRDSKLKAERIDLPTVGIPLEKDHHGHFKPDTTRDPLQELARRHSRGRSEEVQQPARPGCSGHRACDIRRPQLPRGESVPLRRRESPGSGRRFQLGQELGADVQAAIQAESHPGLDGRRQREPSGRAGLYDSRRSLEERPAAGQSSRLSGLFPERQQSIPVPMEKRRGILPRRRPHVVS